jgi:ABC-type arginine/histidine transport system permease subunit
MKKFLYDIRYVIYGCFIGSIANLILSSLSVATKDTLSSITIIFITFLISTPIVVKLDNNYIRKDK